MSDADEVHNSRNPSFRAHVGLKRLRYLRHNRHPAHLSSFDSANILPLEQIPRKSYVDLDSSRFEGAPFGAPAQHANGSLPRSASPPSVFDCPEEQQELDTAPTTVLGSGSDEPGSYDLKPPPPSVSHDNLEDLSTKFFSVEHLDRILRDRTLTSRFNKFLNDYRTRHVPVLAQYLEMKKAITAIEYANAIVDQVPTAPGDEPCQAAELDGRFIAKSKQVMDDLVQDALPAYLTHRLVSIVTDTLVKEITGNGVPVMRELIPSLAEVYCITDPSLPDNPIVYASEGIIEPFLEREMSSLILLRQNSTAPHNTVVNMSSGGTAGSSRDPSLPMPPCDA